jgi:flagellar basal-body rod modification protein FlgD
MAVDAIGSTLTSTNATAANSALNQDDFLKLFLTELTYQDPLEPVNNRDFLAQMAQFANLEQTKQTTDSVNNLVYLNSSSQSVSLLGKKVEVSTSAGGVSGIVSAVTFVADGLSMDVTKGDGSVVQGVVLSQISLIRN